MTSFSLRPTNAILQSLPSCEYELLLPHLTFQTMEAGRLVQEVQEQVRHVYFVESGMVALLTPLDDGQAIEVALIGLEGAVSPQALIDRATSRVRATVQFSGSGCRVSAEQLRALSPQCPSLSRAMALYTGVLFAAAAQKAACNASHDILHRLATWILKSELHFEPSMKLELTHEFLAQMLGVRRPSVTVAAAELQRKGFIRYTRKNIVVTDRTGLEGQACECFASARETVQEFLASIEKCKDDIEPDSN